MTRKRMITLAMTVSLLGVLLAVAGMTVGLKTSRYTSSTTQDGLLITPELIGQLGGTSYASAWQGDYAYLGVGPRPVILDVSVPSTPVITGQTEVFPDIVQGISVVGNYAYVADYTGGLRIINITNPDAPAEIGFYDTESYAGAIAVAGNYAYISDGWDGLRIINISNPSAPTEVGFYDTAGSTYDTVIQGDYAYVADADTGLRVIDVSDPAESHGSWILQHARVCEWG